MQVQPAITSKTLTERSRAELAELLPAEYRYFKSYQHFRVPFDDGAAYLSINAVTHGSGVYYLAFYLGTRVESLQDRIGAVLGEPRRARHHERNISCYSVNIGPSSPHWPYPIRANWALESLADFETHAEQIRTFIMDLAVPFLSSHRTPEAIRHTLLETPGHTINFEPYKEILIASLMNGDPARLLEDVARLERTYATSVDSYRAGFEHVRDRVLQYAKSGGT